MSRPISPDAPLPAGGPPKAIATPCIKVCVVDGESGLCMGCYRQLSEVAGWQRLTDLSRQLTGRTLGLASETEQPPL